MKPTDPRWLTRSQFLRAAGVAAAGLVPVGANAPGAVAHPRERPWDLADAGGIFAGDLKGPKARLLLMVLLSNVKTKASIAETVAALAP